MRKIYIAGNWKMNKTLPETVAFVNELKEALQNDNLTDAIPIIFPPSIWVAKCARLLEGTSIFVGPQDVSRHDSGAYTGEISASMLKSIGLKYCIVGHSERRSYHGESNNLINVKAKSLINYGITPVICIGEQEAEREMGITERVILQQLEEAVGNIDIDNQIIIAYEPVWAIGTGKTATPEIAQEVHQLIRNWLTSNYNEEKANNTSILYGGSVKVDNFQQLLAEKDIDGGLIGGASLDIDGFIQLVRIGIESANSKQSQEQVLT